MLKNKKILILILPLIILLILGTFKYGKTLAKYVSNSVWSYYFRTKDFYFSSDYMDINEKTNINKLWDGTSVAFNIKNSINENLITDYDIEYNVKCEVIGDATTHTKCTLNGEGNSNWTGILSSSKSCVNKKGDSVDVSNYTDEECVNGGYTLVNDEFIKDTYFDIELTDQNYTINDISVKIIAESTNPYKKTIIGNFNLKRVYSDLGSITKEYKNYSNYDTLIISNSYTTNKCLNISWNPTDLLLDDEISKFNTYSSDSNGYINNVKININSKSNVSIKFRSVDKEVTNDITKLTINEEC